MEEADEEPTWLSSTVCVAALVLTVESENRKLGFFVYCCV